MALPHRKIAVLDGDGAVIMNVNGLITVGRVRPKNLIHIVFDNKIYESSGCIPTASAYNLSIADFGRAAGIRAFERSASSMILKAAVKNAFDQMDHTSSSPALSPRRRRQYSKESMRWKEIQVYPPSRKIENRPLRDSIDVKLSIRDARILRCNISLEWLTTAQSISVPDNGLVCALYLARAGWRILLLEQASEVVGGLRSGALTLSGFCHDRYATNVGLF